MCPGPHVALLLAPRVCSVPAGLPARVSGCSRALLDGPAGGRWLTREQNVQRVIQSGTFELCADVGRGTQ